MTEKRPSLPDAPARRVVLHSAEVRRASIGDRVSVRVKLERPSRGMFVGMAASKELEGDLRCTAEAALSALRQAIGPESPVSFSLQEVETFEAFGKQAVMVKLTVQVKDQERSLLGFAPVQEDPPKAAARAILDATNRLLGLG